MNISYLLPGQNPNFIVKTFCIQEDNILAVVQTFEIYQIE